MHAADDRAGREDRVVRAFDGGFALCAIVEDRAHLSRDPPAQVESIARSCQPTLEPYRPHDGELVLDRPATRHRRAPGQDRLFIKFDAWNTLQLPLVREAFPDTPWVFLRRDPVEVLVSALARRGVHTAPGLLPPALFGLDEADARDADAYAAKVLGTIYRAGEAGRALGGGLMLDYRDLPAAAWTTVAAHFGIAPEPAALEAMKALSATDAKRSGQPFQPDGAMKRAAASPALEALADRWMQPAYASPA